MRTQAFPPQILGAPVAVNRLTSSTPYYYSPPAADADGNYSASFSLWDGSGDGAVTATDALTMGKYPWLLNEEWWGLDGAGNASKWGISGYGTTIIRTAGQIAFPHSTYIIDTLRGGIAQLSTTLVGSLVGYNNAASTLYYNTYSPGIFSPGALSSLSVPSYPLLFSRAFSMSETIPLANVSAGSSYTSLVGYRETGAATSYYLTSNQPWNTNSDAMRISDSLGLFYTSDSGLAYVAQYLGGVWSVGGGYSTALLCAAALSSSCAVVVCSYSRLDIISITGTALGLLKSTTVGISITGTIVGMVRLSVNEFLVLSTSGGLLLATRFVVNANNDILQRQTVTIDQTPPVINNHGVQSTVLPFNRVLINYGTGNAQTGWRSKVLRSLA